MSRFLNRPIFEKKNSNSCFLAVLARENENIGKLINDQKPLQKRQNDEILPKTKG